MTALFDPLPAVAALNRHGVEYIVIGGVAAITLGSPLLTSDFDICYRRSKENTNRLASALQELQARPRGMDPALPFILDGATLRNGDTFTFETSAGDLDCLGSPSGTSGYTDLVRAALTVDLGEGLTARVCSLDDLIRMKRAAGRPKDLYAVENLLALRSLIDNQ
jgi:hypothetical protein